MKIRTNHACTYALTQKRTQDINTKQRQQQICFYACSVLCSVHGLSMERNLLKIVVDEIGKKKAEYIVGK